MMGFLIATMSSTATQVTHIVLAPDAQEYLGFYGCLAARRPGGSNVPAILFWTAPFVFNLVMLALATRHSIVASRATESAVTQAFLRDGIWYLSVATVANLVSVLLSAQTVNSNLHTFNAPGSIGLSSVMASRLMLSTLARQAAPRHPFLHNSSHGSRDGGATTRYVPPISSGRATVAHDESAIDHLPHLNDHARRQIRQRALDRDWEEQLDPADEKVDRVSQDVASGLGSTCGVAMECQMSDATLADNRSLRSHGTYENSIKSMPEAEESGREHA
ncbi:uncharacterized protein JCM15063_004641 [Sporobolomyces koalae]|uniref:uncharacterized protein n=1 Tax=Sporobolomyces koalae TaxID=500713 RepID=UPI00316E0480